MSIVTILDFMSTSSLVILGIGGTMIAISLSATLMYVALTLSHSSLDRSMAVWQKKAFKLLVLNLLMTGAILGLVPLMASMEYLCYSKSLTAGTIILSLTLMSSSFCLTPLFLMVTKDIGKNLLKPAKKSFPSLRRYFASYFS